jgi:ADP-ribose pyrophosphatase
MPTWKTLTRRAILHDDRYLTVEHHSVDLGDGRVFHDWPWLVMPEYVNLAVLTEDGRFLCFRQTKYAVAGFTLAVPGGYLDPGEEPLAAAQRELREETGYAAAEWVSLGRFAVDGNRGAGVAHLFLATGARRVAEPDADDLEPQELLLLERDEVERALAAGEFAVLGWAATMALALARLR